MIAILVIVGVVALLLIICMILLFIYATKNKRFFQRGRDANMVQQPRANFNLQQQHNPPSMLKSRTVSSYGVMYDANGQRVNLQRSTISRPLSIYNQSQENIIQYDNDQNNNILIVDDDNDDGDDNKDDDDQRSRFFSEELYVNNHDHKHNDNTIDGDGTVTPLPNDGAVIGELDIDRMSSNVSKAGVIKITTTKRTIKMSRTKEGNEKITINSSDHIGNINEWTQKQVVSWIKRILSKNDITADAIASFVAEFATKNVTGKMLLKCKQNEKLMDQLILQFL